MKNQTHAPKNLATNHPVIFALVLTIVWFVLLLSFTGIASGVLRRPFGDTITGSIGRLAVTACVLALLWRLGWLAAAGLPRLGRWQVWLLTLAGLIYLAGASLRSFYRPATFDLFDLLRLPDSPSVIAAQLVVGLSEEIAFRGLVLYALARAWGNTTVGKIGSVVVASLLFAFLHFTQVFTHAAGVPSALLLTLQTSIVAIWWGALVLLSGSIWPAVAAHIGVNAVVALQGLAEPLVQPELLAYRALLGFSVPLGALAVGLLVSTRARRSAPARR